MLESISLHLFTVFMGFFAIMNPIANTPIFLSLTSEDSTKTTKRIALRALLLAFVIVVAFSVLGKVIFDLFGITLPAFQITGGFIVLLIGYHMLQGNSSSVHQLNEEDSQEAIDAQLSVAISPLAMPLLAGPGTIATAMNFSAGGGIFEMVTTIFAFAVLCVITYFIFIFGERFVTFIGAGALGVITRMMGLILAVIGVQMLIEGIHGAFPLHIN
ncbi:MAG: MarC family protein [Thiotrichales bacterium]|nr:MarC family protein [Thiotrichales bacterium]